MCHSWCHGRRAIIHNLTKLHYNCQPYDPPSNTMQWRYESICIITRTPAQTYYYSPRCARRCPTDGKSGKVQKFQIGKYFHIIFYLFTKMGAQWLNFTKRELFTFSQRLLQLHIFCAFPFWLHPNPLSHADYMLVMEPSCSCGRRFTVPLIFWGSS